MYIIPRVMFIINAGVDLDPTRRFLVSASGSRGWVGYSVNSNCIGYEIREF